MTAELTSVRRQAIRATYWTVASFGLGQVIRLGGNLVLTRLLAPDAFGLMAVVNSFVGGLFMFSDIGTTASIVRNPRGDDPIFLNTAWTLQVVRGFGLFIASALIAWPVSRFYSDARLIALIPLMGVSGAIGGFLSTNACLLSRHMIISRIIKFELFNQCVLLIITVALIWLSPTVWSLAGGNLAAGLVRVAVSHHLYSGPRNRLLIDRESARELVSFGKWLFLSTAMYFLAEQVDRLTLGKLLTLQMLGVYNVAAVLADVPRQVSMALNTKVVFPAIARLAHLPREELRLQIVRNRRPVVFASAAGLAAFVASSDWLIRGLYDRRYNGAAWILPLLALSIWPRVLCNTAEPALYVIGRPQYSTLANFLRFFTTLVGIPLGFARYGLPGAIIVLVVNDLPYYAVAAFGLRRHGLSVLRQDAAASGVFVAALFAAVAGRAALGFGTPIDSLLTTTAVTSL